MVKFEKYLKLKLRNSEAEMKEIVAYKKKNVYILFFTGEGRMYRKIVKHAKNNVFIKNNIFLFKQIIQEQS